MFRLLSNGDPKLKIIPKWIINFMTRKLAYGVVMKMKNLVKVMKDYGHYERIEEKKDFYDQVRERLFEIQKPD